MNLTEFVKAFAKQFEDTDPSIITETSDFKNLDEWNSLVALSVIAMADEEYGVTLTGDDIRNAKTVHDLFNKVASLKSA